MLSISPPDALSQTVNSGAEVAVARIRLPQPPVIEANGSWAPFCTPRVTEEPVLSACLPTPPVTAVNPLGWPGTSLQMLFTDGVPGPARFEQPPVILLQPPPAVLAYPPLTLAAVLLAALF